MTVLSSDVHLTLVHCSLPLTVIRRPPALCKRADRFYRHSNRLNSNRLAGSAAFKANDRDTNVHVLAIEQQSCRWLRLDTTAAARGAMPAREIMALMAADCASHSGRRFEWLTKKGRHWSLSIHSMRAESRSLPILSTERTLSAGAGLVATTSVSNVICSGATAMPEALIAAATSLGADGIVFRRRRQCGQRGAGQCDRPQNRFNSRHQ